jgi:atypical dual specificity phosphatase
MFLEPDRPVLRRLGINVIVSLQAERGPGFAGMEAEAYLWLPTVDATPPTMAQLRLGAGFIDQAVRAGHKVYVHCYAGVGRSPLVCAAYLITQGYTSEEAWDQVERARPYAALNAAQWDRLREFEEEVIARPLSGVQGPV